MELCFRKLLLAARWKTSENRDGSRKVGKGGGHRLREGI